LTDLESRQQLNFLKFDIMNIDQVALSQWIKIKLKQAKSDRETHVLLELADDFNLFDVDEFLVESE